MLALLLALTLDWQTHPLTWAITGCEIRPLAQGGVWQQDMEQWGHPHDPGAVEVFSGSYPWINIPSEDALCYVVLGIGKSSFTTFWWEQGWTWWLDPWKCLSAVPHSAMWSNYPPDLIYTSGIGTKRWRFPGHSSSPYWGPFPWHLLPHGLDMYAQAFVIDPGLVRAPYYQAGGPYTPGPPVLFSDVLWWRYIP